MNNNETNTCVFKEYERLKWTSQRKVDSSKKESIPHVSFILMWGFIF